MQCWGGNPNKQLGVGYGQESATPATGKVLGITDAIAISAGATHACAVLYGGYVNCWGEGAGRGPIPCTPIGAYYPGVAYSYPMFNGGACLPGTSATPYAVGLSGLSPLEDILMVLQWAEATLPQTFPARPIGFVPLLINNYYDRAYPGNTYLAVNGHGTPHLMYLGPESGGQLADLGRLASWVRQARASQPVTPPISTTLQLQRVYVNVDFFPGPPRTSCNNLSIWFNLGATAGYTLPAGFKPTSVRLLKGDTYVDVPDVGVDTASSPPPNTYTGRAWGCPATLIRGDDEVEVVLYFTIDGVAGQVRAPAKVTESS